MSLHVVVVAVVAAADDVIQWVFLLLPFSFASERDSEVDWPWSWSSSLSLMVTEIKDAKSNDYLFNMQLHVKFRIEVFY